MDEVRFLGDLTRAAVHGLFEDLELVVELCKQRALAERPRDEAPLQLVGDVVACRDLLLGLGRLGQQLERQDGRKLKMVFKHAEGAEG